MLLRAMTRLVIVYQSIPPGRPLRSELGNEETLCMNYQFISFSMFRDTHFLRPTYGFALPLLTLPYLVL